MSRRSVRENSRPATGTAAASAASVWKSRAVRARWTRGVLSAASGVVRSGTVMRRISLSSTPRVHRARTARDFQTLVADAAAVPVAGRDFSRTERLLIRFDVYGTSVPAAALLNRNGDKMSDVPVAPAKAGGTHQIDLGLSSIAIGEYVIEITAKGGTGEAKELVPIRIGS